MAAKPNPDKNRDPEEYKRFLETAKQLDADQTPEAFAKAFKRVARASSATSVPAGNAEKPLARKSGRLPVKSA
jgi:hypothetical protein